MKPAKGPGAVQSPADEQRNRQMRGLTFVAHPAFAGQLASLAQVRVQMSRPALTNGELRQ